ncbi:transcriptional regulator [Leifsonia sp. ku-ls]|nr:transcriptional regulator [Leifsonia sp. ku-ls]
MTAALSGAAPVFAALGDPTRLDLVLALGEHGPGTASRLAAERPVTRQAVEKHLAILGAAGLVRSERIGRERLWRVEPAALATAGTLLQQASERWDAALRRLREHVEADAGQDASASSRKRITDSPGRPARS